MSEENPPSSEAKPSPEHHMCLGPDFCQVCKENILKTVGPAEMVSISKAELDALVANQHKLNAQINILGGVCRILLQGAGGALVFNNIAAEDAVDDVEIHIMPTRQGAPASEILNLIHQGVNIDESFIAVLKDRPPQVKLKMKGQRVEARKKKAQQEAAQNLLRVDGGLKKKGRLLLLGGDSNEGSKH